MPVVPGTKVTASFFTFGSTPPPGPNDPAQFPTLYYGSGKGLLNLASINAGNARALDVGGGGVNKQFRLDLLAAGQKHVDSGSDDYQSRHNKLLAKAGSGTASESYQSEDPCVFSYVQASLINTKAGWHEGVCFVDVFSTKLCPAGNPLNVAMVYAAPPFGDNYTDEADFLAHIQAMAANIIKTVSGYNAIAGAQKLPKIEALRNTLFSSGIYNRSAPNKVDPGKIARAIFAGFQAQLQIDDGGLLELDFPVGRGAQDLLFGPVQDDLTSAPAPVPTPGKRKPPVIIETGSEDGSKSNDDDDGDGVELEKMGGQADSNAATKKVTVKTQTGQSAQQAVGNEYGRVSQALQGGKPPGDYEGVGDVLGNPGDDTNIPDAPAQAAPNTNPQVPPPVVQAQGVPADVGLQPGGNPIDPEASESSSENDEQGYSTCCKAVGATIGLLFGGAAVAGSFLWAFLYGGGRKYVSSGIGKFGANDQTVNANDLDATVDVDLITLNSLILIDNITFSIPTTTGPTQATGGSWSVTPATHALFTPNSVGANSSASVQYVLVASAVPGTNAQTDPQKLTVNFTPTPALPVAQAFTTRTGLDVDVPSKITNFAGAIRLIDSTGSQSIGFTKTGVGTWAVTSANHITFAPDPALTGTTAAVNYVRLTTWGVASNQATLTMTFPAATAPALTGGAKFVTTDSKTLGDWLPSYGAEGFAIAGDTASNPKYVTPGLPTAVTTFTNTSTTSPLVKASAPATRVAAAWSAASPIVIDLPCNDTTTVHQVACYFAGYDPSAAGQTVTVLDANGTVLDTQTVPALTGGGTGVYLVWTVTGHVKINISNAAGSAGVLSGIFFGGPTVTATFVSSDTTTEGTWQGVYGADGYVIAGNQTGTGGQNYVKTPSYGGATVAAPETSFAPTSGDPGVPQLPPNTTSTQTTLWYQSPPSAISIDLSFTDSAVHQVAIYCWDESGARKQTVQVLDAAGTILDTQMLSSFDGVYLKWKVRGHVTINIVSTVNDNAVLSGIFFDPAPTTMAFAAVSAAPVAYDFTVWMLDAPQNVKLDFLKHCNIPGGFKSIELSDGTANKPSDDVTVPKQGRWSYESSGTPPTMDVLFEPVAGLLLNRPYSIKYRIVDQHGVKSNQATMTVDYTALARLMPRAANFLSSADARYGKFSAADVLANSSAFFGIKKGSVVLVGLQDVLQGNPAPAAYVRNDGRAMSVQGEGMWMVDDNDLIVFQSDANLSYHPKPALFRFSDSKGYQSNPAVVLFDKDATDSITKVPPALAKITDADFWKNYATSVKYFGTDPVTGSPNDPLPEQFVAMTQSLAVATRTLGSVGPDPFAKLDLDTDLNFQSWAGGAWADLQTMCAKMTAAALPGTAPQYAARYWQLNLMVRMALKAFPPS